MQWSLFLKIKNYFIQKEKATLVVVILWVLKILSKFKWRYLLSIIIHWCVGEGGDENSFYLISMSSLVTV